MIGIDVEQNLYFPTGLLVKVQRVVNEKKSESSFFPSTYMNKTTVVVKYNFNNMCLIL